MKLSEEQIKDLLIETFPRAKDDPETPEIAKFIALIRDRIIEPMLQEIALRDSVRAYITTYSNHDPSLALEYVRKRLKAENAIVAELARQE